MKRIGRLLLFILLCVSISCRKSFDEFSQTEIIVNSFSNNPFYYHFAPNSFVKDGLNRKAIASESIEDVALAARLGFQFVEANIWETADGHYVCIHGEDGKFGLEVMSIDSTVISTNDLRKTEISSVTLDWIKNYVRYDSDYQQYQTTIPSLEEFCKACQHNGIGILAGVAGKRKPVEICIRHLADRVVVYGPPDNIRDYFKGYVLTWNNNTGSSLQSLLKKAKYYGGPYICSLGRRVIADLEEQNELEAFIEEMHRNNFLVGWASVYSREMDSMKYLKLGMDVSGSGHEVNSFESNYELYDLGDNSHLPSTTGSISDGKLRLSSQDTIICGSPDMIHVGKGALSIRFKGIIRVCFGSLGNTGDRYELKSEGDETLVFTDFFFNRGTTLTIYSLSDNTVIDHFVYSTTIC